MELSHPDVHVMRSSPFRKLCGTDESNQFHFLITKLGGTLKLQDLEKFKRELGPFIQQELEGSIADRFTMEKTLVLDATEEELKQLAHEFVITVTDEFIFDTMKEVIIYLRTGGGPNV